MNVRQVTNFVTCRWLRCRKLALPFTTISQKIRPYTGEDWITRSDEDRRGSSRADVRGHRRRRARQLGGAPSTGVRRGERRQLRRSGHPVCERRRCGGGPRACRDAVSARLRRWYRRRLRYNLGILYETGQGVGTDLPRAVGLYPACPTQRWHALSCTNLGLLYASGQGVGSDLARAAAWYQKGCDGGFAAGCTNLGVLAATGQGVAKDLARAATLYQRGCDGDSALGCANLGALYVSGQGVAIDLAHAAALFQHACDTGAAGGCTNLGILYATGKGVTADLARAATLYQQACDGYDAAGCTDLRTACARNSSGVTHRSRACRGVVSVGL